MALIGAAGLVSVANAQSAWNYVDGHVSIQFDRASLSRRNIKLSDVKGLDATAALRMPGNAWSINPLMSTLELDLDGRDTVSVGTGELTVNGGFTLSKGRGSVSFQDFGLQQGKERGAADFNLVGYHYPPYGPVNLEASSPIVQLDKRTGLVQMTSYELRISPELASYWGDPSMEGAKVGSLNIVGIIKPANLPVPSGNPRTGPELDIAMCRMYGFSVISGGAATINGVPYSTFTCGTDSVNFGANAVTWLSTSQAANINHMHPTIALNVYRKRTTGELEQIGEGQVKHAFTALQQSTCGSCTSSGGGSALGVGCADPYVASLNSSQGSLGPKIEVNPYTGIWNKTGSWWATKPPGYVYSPTELRMKVANQDILPAGQATYYVEGFYMAGFANNGGSATTNPALITATIDTNKVNNFGWRQVNMSVNTSGVASGSDLGSFTANNDEVNNPNRRPVVMTWGDGRQILEPRLAGDVITAYRVTAVSGDPGWYKYDYAVYNMDLDRQVNSFHVSVDDSVSVRNITFRDIDKDNANEWTMTRANGDISWEMQQGNSNPLMYARLYNFRFEAQAAAVPSWASATMIKSGDFPELNHAVTGPPPSTQPITGTITIPNWVGPVPAQVDLRLTPVDSGSLTNVNDVPVGPSGAISAATQVRGRYLVSVGGAPFLRKNFAPVVTIGHDGNDIPINVTLISGDVDGSGEIDAADIDMVISQFGLTDPTVCDVDGSGEVDAADIDLVIGNFGQTGD